jgi:hypothetical protein
MFVNYVKSCLSVAVDSASPRAVSDFSTFNKHWVDEWTATGEDVSIVVTDAS